MIFAAIFIILLLFIISTISYMNKCQLGMSKMLIVECVKYIYTLNVHSKNEPT